MASPTNPSARAQQGARTRDRILAAARGVLAERGPDGFTTRRVAERAGISHGMVHYHFDDKRDLVLALLMHARRDWIEPLEELVDGPGSAEDRMRAVIAWMGEPATTDVMRVHMSIYVFALGDEVIRERYAAEYARWRAPFVTLFAQMGDELGIRGFDAKSVGEAFASAADGLVQQQAIDPSLPTSRMLTRLFERTIGSESTKAQRTEVAVDLEHARWGVTQPMQDAVESMCAERPNRLHAIEVQDLDQVFLTGSTFEQDPALGVDADASAAADRHRGVRVDDVALIHDCVRAREHEFLLAVGRRREGGVQDDLGALEREAPGHLREPAVVADHHADRADVRYPEDRRRLDRPVRDVRTGRQVKTLRYRETSRPVGENAIAVLYVRSPSRSTIEPATIHRPTRFAILPTARVSGPGSPAGARRRIRRVGA